MFLNTVLILLYVVYTESDKLKEDEDLYVSPDANPIYIKDFNYSKKDLADLSSLYDQIDTNSTSVNKTDDSQNLDDMNHLDIKDKLYQAVNDNVKKSSEMQNSVVLLAERVNSILNETKKINKKLEDKLREESHKNPYTVIEFDDFNETISENKEKQVEKEENASDKIKLPDFKDKVIAVKVIEPVPWVMLNKLTNEFLNERFYFYLLNLNILEHKFKKGEEKSKIIEQLVEIMDYLSAEIAFVESDILAVEATVFKS